MSGTLSSKLFWVIEVILFMISDALQGRAVLQVFEEYQKDGMMLCIREYAKESAQSSTAEGPRDLRPDCGRPRGTTSLTTTSEDALIFPFGSTCTLRRYCTAGDAPTEHRCTPECRQGTLNCRLKPSIPKSARNDFNPRALVPLRSDGAFASPAPG